MAAARVGNEKEDEPKDEVDRWGESPMEKAGRRVVMETQRGRRREAVCHIYMTQTRR